PSRMSLVALTLCFFFSLCFRPPPDLPSFLHDALPICIAHPPRGCLTGLDVMSLPGTQLSLTRRSGDLGRTIRAATCTRRQQTSRSEEHTSELQSLTKLVCRLLLANNKATHYPHTTRPA